MGSGFAAELHAEAYRDVPNAEIVAVASPSPGKAQSFAKKHGIARSYTDYQALLKMPEVEVLDICVPNYLHSRICMEAAEDGKHVIVEKPLATTLGEADDMIKACRKAGIKLMYGENVCFAPKYVRAKQLVDEGALGRVYLVKQSEKHFGPHSDWFWDVERSGGGVLLDMGCHGIEFARWILGKQRPKSVWAHCATFVHSKSTRGDDNSLCLVEFESGAVALIEVSWARRGGMDDRAEIYGSEGVTYADLLHGIALETYSEPGYGYAVEKAPSTKGWTFTVYDEVWNYGFPHELRHFMDCVLNDEEPMEKGEDGRTVLEVICAAYESARLGQRVSLPFRSEYRRPVEYWLQR